MLALLDDSSTPYRVRGCAMLTRFLKSAPPGLLERTGLDQVFEDTLKPYLLYLPSLTPEEESLLLLDAVYLALLALARARHNEARHQQKKQKALNSIFRCGILKGYTIAGENVRIATFLIQKMEELIKDMGVASCQHLKVA